MKLNQRTFITQTDGVFAAQLEEYGFSLDGDDHEDDWHVCRRYRSSEQYIEITADCHFRDGDPECRVILGVGSNEWPECDWNRIALWRLSGTNSNYPFGTPNDIPKVLRKMLHDLLYYAKDFLNGDLAHFLETLATQTREREPYKTYSPQSDGSYETIIDPESQALKERYTKPINE